MSMYDWDYYQEHKDEPRFKHGPWHIYWRKRQERSDWHPSYPPAADN